MRVLTPWREGFLAVVGLSIIAVASGGCSPSEETPREPSQHGQPAAQPSATLSAPEPAVPARQGPAAARPAAAKGEAAQPAKAVPPQVVVTKELEEIAAKPPDLGPPLVENPKSLRRLHPSAPVWMDLQNRRVVLMGEACRAGYPLEFFATYTNRSYEAVVAVNVAPSIIHAGLLAVGAKPGHPARFPPDFSPPTGTEVAIEVRWKDEKGKVRSAPAGDWIRDIKTKKPLKMNWVFAGSQFVTDQETGKKRYEADGGDMICVLSCASAMLDLPVYGSRDLESRTYQAFAERLPPAGTPVTLLLKPILPPATKPPQPGTRPTRTMTPTEPPPTEPPPTEPLPAEKAQAEKQAAEAAANWLKLVDEEEYSRAWEAAAEDFKTKLDRREWVKSIALVRKPLGKVKTRQIESQSFEETSADAGRLQTFTARYQVGFENGKRAAETIILTRDRSHAWHVADHQIGEERATERTNTPPPPAPAARGGIDRRGRPSARLAPFCEPEFGIGKRATNSHA